MARVLQWIFRIIGGSLILSFIILAFVFYIVLRSLPDYDKSVELPGIIAPIEIVRDTFNVPHIYGKNDTDLYFGLGYAHAQDRLWQLVVERDLHHQGMYMNGGRNHHFGPPPTQEG